jgi:hypothetical protein
MTAPEKNVSVTLIAIRSGPQNIACPSGEAIPAWLLSPFTKEPTFIHRKDKENEF